jgi:hypothetical protein
VKLPTPWLDLIEILASGDGRSLYGSDLGARSESVLPELLRLANVPAGQWRQELAQIALWRAFIATLPSRIFERPRDPCRDLVIGRLVFLLGEQPPEAAVRALMTVVKRIQRYQIGGRAALRASTIDLTSVIQHDIFKTQARRCACCGYLFKDEDLDPSQDSSEDGSINSGARTFLFRRRAVLDHILPVYIAGDRPENWQILCAGCNMGKSDSILGFDHEEWFGSARARRQIEVRARLSYMVLRRVCTDTTSV